MAALNRMGSAVQNQMHILIDIFNQGVIDRQLTASTISGCGGRDVDK